VSRLVSGMAAATVVVSPEIARRCHGSLIPCGVDLEKFRPVDREYARQRVGLSASCTYVLFPFDPGRQLKRHDLAEAAVALLRRQGMDVSLLAVWNASNDQMPLYYAAADAMVLCSDTEGSPTSVKEALACNLPVVSTDVGDVRAIMRGVEGTEICDQNAPSIAMALARVLERSEVAAFDGRSAMGGYEQRATTEALVAVYRRVIRRTPRIPVRVSGSG